MFYRYKLYRLRLKAQELYDFYSHIQINFSLEILSFILNKNSAK
ncbi:hypothetical protein MCY_01024 [Bartonella rattimassiliensis 15908]|uniref:Uncharacterized protein n=1 Tax=Bartonella rattimassiliensis 15908 TaxID=1094556 RepID=J0ZC41_9HYPH|nr:hypothetical protein MCY_01024 [Bartonella rattimassiliensis 15908]